MTRCLRSLASVWGCRAKRKKLLGNSSKVGTDSRKRVYFRREREREGGREREREGGREGEREKEKERGREGGRERGREGETERQRYTHTLFR